MLRDRGDGRVGYPARLVTDADEILVAEHVVQGTQALQVRVEVDTPVAVEDLQPQDVGPLDWGAQTLEDLRADRILREVLLGPQPVLPARVVPLPALDPGPMV